VFIGAIIEHIENAGVHSGDATMCIPPQTLSKEIIKTLEDCTYKIVTSLKIKGPFNIQYIVKDDKVYVIECNLRASRSMPFVSKTIGMNLMELSTMAMLDKKFKESKIQRKEKIQHIGVKAPQFSFMRLNGADPLLGVEMQSTGEVACLGENFSDALVKALQSAEFHVPKNGGSVLISVSDDEKKKEIIPLIIDLQRMGFKIYATEPIVQALKDEGINDAITLHKVNEIDKNPNPIQFLSQRKIDLVINIPVKNSQTSKDDYIIRRVAVEFNVPVVTTMELASSLVKALKYLRNSKPTVRPLPEYFLS
ncbi:MAG: carbamoyl phosphate synthase large subunit, partial [Candidatus Bathyarchaeia archaeon]